MYGHRGRPLWSEAENLGQLVMACIWAAALLLLLFALFRSTRRPPPSADATPTPAVPKRGLGWPLQLGILLLFISFVFLAVRYGIISAGANVLIGYRFESSVVVLLQRLGLPLIFLALYQFATPTDVHKGRATTLLKVPYLLLLVAYTALNIGYLVTDFLVSASALSSFKHDGWTWRSGDRDFSLTMTKGMIETLKWVGPGMGFAPGFIRGKLYDFEGEAYLDHRSVQIKLGLAADAVAVVLSLLLLALAGSAWLDGRRLGGGKGRRSALLLVAGLGMLLSTLFTLIVTAHFVSWNFGVVTDPAQWFAFIFEYEREEDGFGIPDYLPPDGFLPKYRVAVDGFLLVQAIIQPLGIVVACAAAVYSGRAEGEHSPTKDVHGYERKDERLA